MLIHAPIVPRYDPSIVHITLPSAVTCTVNVLSETGATIQAGLAATRHAATTLFYIDLVATVTAVDARTQNQTTWILEWVPSAGATEYSSIVLNPAVSAEGAPRGPISTCPLVSGYPKLEARWPAIASPGAVTVSIYDLSSATPATPLATGIATAAGLGTNSFIVDTGVTPFITSLDLLVQESGHYMVRFVAVGAEDIDIEVLSNTPEHLDILYPDGAVYVDTNASALVSTAFPAGSILRPATTPAELAAVVTARNPNIIDFLGTWGGATLTSAAIGTAFVGRLIRGNITGRSNALYVAASNNVAAHNTIFDNIGVSTINSNSTVTGFVTLRNNCRIIGSLVNTGNGTNFGGVSATDCLVGGVTCSRRGTADPDHSWSADFTRCTFEPGAVVSYVWAAGSTSSYVECIGDVQISGIRPVSLYGGAMAVTMNGHKGSAVINFDGSNSSAGSFTVSGAIDTLINTAGMTNNGFRKLAHRSDLSIGELVSSGGSATVVNTNGSAPNGYYDGAAVIVKDASTGFAAIRRVDTYANASGAFTLTQALPFTPVSGDEVIVYPQALLGLVPDVQAAITAAEPIDANLIQVNGIAQVIADFRATGFAVAGDAMALTAGAVDAVWDEATAGHIGAGSFGVAVTDVLADTASIQPAVATNLDATISSRAVAGDAMALTVGERTTVQALILSDATPFAGASIDAAITTRAVAGDAMDLTGAAVDAVWDELSAGHVGAGSFGLLLTDVLADTAAIQPLVATNLDATISSRAVAGDAMALTAGERTTVQALILSDATPFAGANIDAAITSRAVAGDAMALTGAAVDAVWDEATAGHVGAGSFGLLLTDVLADTASIQPTVATNLDATISSRAVAGDAMDLTVGAVDAVWDEATAGHVGAGTFGVAVTDVLADTAAIQPLVATNLDATISSRAVAGDAMALTAGERTTVQALILSDATPFAGANIDAAITSRAVAGDAMALTSGAVDAIWDELVAGHTGVGTTGEALQAGGVSPATIADAVWDELSAGHVGAGSFGLLLTDVLADTASIQPTVATNLDATISSRAVAGDAMALTAGERTTVQALILSDATPFAGANIDAAITSRAVAGDAMALTAGAVDAVWDELVAGHVGAGSFGLLLTDVLADTAAIQPTVATNLDALVSSRAVAGDAMALTAGAVDAVWDELVAGHTGVGTTGEALQIGGVSPATIADAVWDELSAGHVGAGSFGLLLTDVLADTASIQPLVATNIDATISSRAVAGDAMTLTAGAVDAVWDELVAGHVGVGTTGEALQAGGASPATIADAVWDELSAGHVGAGSFGLLLTDVLADTAAIQPTVATNLDATISSRAVAGDAMALTAGERTTVQALILSDATPFAGANIDATISSRAVAGDAMTLTAGAVDAVWDELSAGHVGAGSFGLLLTDVLADTAAIQPTVATNLDATISSRAVAGDAMALTAGAVDTIWDEAIAGHIGAGTTGEALQAGGASPATIADAVWDELSAGHVGAGSFGALMEVLRKGNLSTDGIVVAGTLTTMSFDTNLTEADTTFDHQMLVFTTGALQGQARPIDTFVGGRITLQEALTVIPSVNDEFTILVQHVHPSSGGSGGGGSCYTGLTARFYP